MCIDNKGKQTYNFVPEKTGAFRYLPRPGYENYPANNVSSYGAEGFCRWKGNVFRGESEWEKAARGDDRRVYPWGDRFPNEHTSRYDRAWPSKGLNVLLPVDSLPEGRSYYGVYNMAGNVLEWNERLVPAKLL